VIGSTNGNALSLDYFKFLNMYILKTFYVADVMRQSIMFSPKGKIKTTYSGEEEHGSQK